MITLTDDIDWLGRFPEQWFREQDQARQEKGERHAFAWRVMRGEDCPEAGHNDVAKVHRYKDLIMRQSISVWGGLLSDRVFPGEAQVIEIEPDKPDDELDKVKAEVVQAVFREKLKDFFSDAINYAVDSGTGFGGVCLTGVEMEYDDDAGGERVCFRRRWIDFGDFVLDSAAPNWKHSPMCRRLRYSRAQLMELSQPVEGQREAIFDREAVERLFQAQPGGVLAIGNSDIRDEKDDADGSSDQGGKDWFDCFEYVGTVIRDGEVLGEKQIITSCGGICLRATDDPDPERSWVLFGSEDGQLGDPYPESKGYLVAMKETAINFYGTLMAHQRSTEAFGMFQFDVGDAAIVEKWGHLVQFGPRKKIPKVFEQFPYKATSDGFKEVKEENTAAILRLVGVSDSALVGNPQPGVSATAAAGFQAMAATRISLDARHYYPLYEMLLQCHYRLLLESWDGEVATIDNGKRYMITREDLGDFKGRMVLSTAGNVTPNPVRLQNWERVKGDIAGAIQANLVDPMEFHKVNAEHYGLDPVTVQRLFKPPAPPPAPAPQVTQGGAPPEMAGPVVDNVVQMPGMVGAA